MQKDLFIEMAAKAPGADKSAPTDGRMMVKVAG